MDGAGHHPHQLGVRPGARAVAVPAREQNLSGTEPRAFARPGHRVGPRGLAAAECQRLPPVSRAAGVDGEDHALAAKLGGELGEERGTLQRGRIHAHLVRARREQAPCIVDAPDAPTHGEGNPDRGADARHRVDLGGPSLGRRGNIEHDELVRPLGLVPRALGGRVARVPQILEANPLHDPTVLDVQARHHAG